MEVALKNLMEEIVLKKLDELLKEIDCCKCEQCRLDIASYALNRLPAKYIATTQGKLISMVNAVNSQFETDVVSAIVRGIQLIRDNPNHLR